MYPRVADLLLLLGFTTLLTSQVITAAFHSERENSDKFCSEALISAWISFTCRESTRRDPRLYFPSEGSHTQDFYALKKFVDPGRDRTREAVMSRPIAVLIRIFIATEESITYGKSNNCTLYKNISFSGDILT